MSKENVRYYKDFDTDFFETEEKHSLPEDYQWIRTNLRSRILSAIIYTAAFLFANVYCRLVLHVRIKGADKVRHVKDNGFFLYGNHTQPVGDVFTPALICFPKRIYTVVSPANFALPVIGKILPYLGALPISESLHGMKEFQKALECRIRQKHPVIIYPEAHVWEYYTKIRPFPATSFKFPVKLDVPVFCFTVTYQKRRFGKRPKATVYVDGPFPVREQNTREAAERLRDEVYQTMLQRSEQSSYAYVEYQKMQEDCF